MLCGVSLGALGCELGCLGGCLNFWVDAWVFVWVLLTASTMCWQIKGDYKPTNPSDYCVGKYVDCVVARLEALASLDVCLGVCYLGVYVFRYLN